MVFDFEKIEVYRLSLEVIDSSVAVADSIPRGQRHLSDQLKRACTSISLNIAEGVGEFKAIEKARFYRMALRSASESCAILQLARRLNITKDSDYEALYEMLARVSKMLTKLISSMEARHPIRDRDRDGGPGIGSSGAGARDLKDGSF